MLTRNDRFLAALIFLLWSVGVFIVPVLSPNTLPYASLYIACAYVIMHAVAALYVLLLLPGVAHELGRGRRGARVRALAYAYVLVMLVLSAYFVVVQL